MSLTGSQHALTFSRLHQMRLGASRLGFFQPIISILINGIPADGTTRRVRIEGISIRDLLDGTPNTATMRVSGFTPIKGQEIKIALGSVDTSHLLFAGHILSVAQVYELDVARNVAYDLNCISYEWLLNRRTVTARYTAASATAVVLDLMALFTSGFTTAHVEAGLETLDEITFTNVDMTTALDQVARRIGAHWVVDYGKDLHFGVGPLLDSGTPFTISSANTHSARNIQQSVDLSQVRTRVYVEGGGSTASAPVATTAAFIPIEDDSWYETGGGWVVAGPQRLMYSGVSPGGPGSTILSVSGPTSAPTAAIGTGAGHVLGVVSYKVSFKNSAGETTVGSTSNTVTGVAFSAPGSVASLAAASGLGRLVGVYNYKLAFVTALGETTLNATPASITLAAVSAPSAPSVSLGSGIGRLVGAYGYKVTYVTPYGETLASSAGSRTGVAVAAPGQPNAAEVSSTIGPLIGAYNYKITFVTPYGETLPGTARAITTTAQSAPSAPSAAVTTNIGPLFAGAISYKVSFVSALGETMGTATSNFSPSAFVASAPTVGGSGTGLEIAYAVTYVHPVYGESALSSRTVDTDKGTNPVVTVNSLPTGCGWNVYSTGTVAAGNGSTAALFKVAEMAVGTSSFTHTTQTGPAEGVRASLGTTVSVTSIPTGPTGTVARRIYRPRAGGSTYYLVGELGDNSTTSFTDNVPDTALTVTAPSVNPNGKQVSVTAIPTGPTGTLARRVYRTKPGGSEYFRVGEIQDNTTTSFTDLTPDTSLTEDAPLVSTAGGDVHTVTMATGATGTTARRIYRTESGGTTYRLLAEIADNVTTTYNDTKADSELGGVNEPLANTAGGQNVSLSSIPTGPTGTTARHLYRTKAGGSEYFLAAQIGDNSTTTFTDSQTDAELSSPAPLLNTAGASTVSLSSIPLGPSGITSRRIYRTEGGGSTYRYVAEIRDNTATTYTDTLADTELGDVAPTTGTLGALSGATSLSLVSASGFLSSGGWARIGSQMVRYTGISGSSLTGLPSSGDGALLSAISAGTQVLPQAMLTGIPQSGTGAINWAIAQGDDINLWIVCDDAAAQTAMAALTGGDGVVEDYIQDRRLSAQEARARGNARLELVKDPLVSVQYQTEDRQTVAGRDVTFALDAPGPTGTFKVQTVTITQIDPLFRRFPLRTVEASSRRFTFEDVLRLLKAA